jgi:molybdopterin converting factor small subunit
MNTYSIQYFGLLAERRGLASEAITSAAATPAAIYQEIDGRHPLGMAMKDLRAVVNDEFSSWNQPLIDGDRIAFLPPMSGG